MGLLSGLGKLGLGKFENVDIYEDRRANADKGAGGQNGQNSVAEVMTEKDYLFEKTYECPVCDKQFKEMTVRAGKVKSAGSDFDLRPKYEGIDSLKYDTVFCRSCGYAALPRYFKGMSATQRKFIKENISADFKDDSKVSEDGTITYEEAIYRHKLCLANAIVKMGKESEKAYICLKTAWIIRGMRENLDKKQEDYEAVVAQTKADEAEFLKSAMDGFIAARTKEAFPMCGMDETTLDYLLARLAMHFEQDDLASRMISNILSSRTANARIKDKARDVKEELLKRKQEAKNA